MEGVLKKADISEGITVDEENLGEGLPMTLLSSRKN